MTSYGDMGEILREATRLQRAGELTLETFMPLWRAAKAFGDRGHLVHIGRPEWFDVFDLVPDPPIRISE